MSKSSAMTDAKILAAIKSEHKWELKRGVLICFGISVLAWWSYDHTLSTQIHDFHVTVDGDLANLISAFSKLAWPFSALAIGLSFKSELVLLLRRIKKLSAGSTDIEFEQNQGQPTNAAAEIPTQMQINVSAYAQTYATKIQTAVTATPETVRIPELIKFSANALAAVDFEHEYGLIFGTQLDALKYLRNHGTPVSLTPYYRQHVEKVGETSHPIAELNQWAIFLVNRGLIIPATEANAYQITDKGRDFLQYVENKNYPSRAW